LHKVTGAKYGECRAILKANNWDLLKALLHFDGYFDETVYRVSNTVINTMKILIPLIEDSVNSFYKCCQQLGAALSDVLNNINIGGSGNE
jgi:hypothetical protein